MVMCRGQRAYLRHCPALSSVIPGLTGNPLTARLSADLSPTCPAARVFGPNPPARRPGRRRARAARRSKRRTERTEQWTPGQAGDDGGENGARAHTWIAGAFARGRMHSRGQSSHCSACSSPTEPAPTRLFPSSLPGFVRALQRTAAYAERDGSPGQSRGMTMVRAVMTAALPSPTPSSKFQVPSSKFPKRDAKSNGIPKRKRPRSEARPHKLSSPRIRSLRIARRQINRRRIRSSRPRRLPDR